VGAAFRIASASFGASTPFITSTPRSAVTFASAAEEERFGLAAGGVASAEVVFAALAVFPLAVLASLLPAMTGEAAMASTSRLDNNCFSVNMDGGS
jgi:hypothetical protein